MIHLCSTPIDRNKGQGVEVGMVQEKLATEDTLVSHAVHQARS